MHIDTYKRELWRIASDDQIQLCELESFIESFYKKIPLPTASYILEHVVRASINADNEIFTTVARCSYNPHIEKIDLARCNYPQQQVFYAAIPSREPSITASSTALLETTFEHIRDHRIMHKTITVSRWAIRRPLRLFVFPFSQSCVKNNIDMKVANDNLQLLLENISDTSAGERQHYKDALEYMSDIFCAPDERNINYRISAAFFNFLMKQSFNGHSLDGLLYPSANTLAHGMNVVLRKELIDNGALVCDYVQMYRMVRNPDDVMDIAFPPIFPHAVPNQEGRYNFTQRP